MLTEGKVKDEYMKHEAGKNIIIFIVVNWPKKKEKDTKVYRLG